MAFVWVAGAAAKDLKTISLKYSDHSPPTSGGAIFTKKEWFPLVQAELAKIGYKLDITYYHASSLYKYQDQVQACELGLIDMTLFSLSYELARAPLHEVISMPFMGYSAQSANQIWFDLQDSIPAFGSEFRNYMEIFHFMALPRVLNANKELRVPADFKGLKVQSAGMVADMFRSIGAIPIRQAPGDWYTSLDRDLIDGIALGIAGVTMFKLQEVVKIHIIPVGDSMGYVGTSLIMNQRRFKKMPAEVQKILRDKVVWASRRMTEIEEENNIAAEKICKEAGNEFVQLTADETDQWRNAFKPLKAEWVKKMDAKGLPGQEVYDSALSLAKNFTK